MRYITYTDTETALKLNIIMKTTKFCFLLGAFFLLHLSSFAQQDDVLTVRSGLILSYFLKIGEYDSIRNTLSRLGYQYDSKNSEYNFKVYEKIISPSRHRFCMINTRKEDFHQVSFAESDTEGAFFFDRVKNYMLANFKHKKGEEDFFIVTVKNPHPESSSEKYKDYIWSSVIDVRQDLFSFYEPALCDLDLNWNVVFRNIFK